jgi:signal transduction histidine kinase
LTVSLILRVARAGVAAALLVAAIGWALERDRFGSTDQEAAAHVESELRQRFDASADTLGAIASRAAAARDAIARAPRDAAAVTRLFDAVDASLSVEQAGRTGVTIYSPNAAPLAWAGRVSDLPASRIDGPPALFVAPSALGPRLVRVEPLTDGSSPSAARLATIAVEQTLATVQGAPGMADTFVLSTSVAPVTLRVRLPPDAPPPPSGTGVHSFVIPSRGGGALLDAELSRQELDAARARWRRSVMASAVSVLALTLLLCTGPLIDWRHTARDVPRFLQGTLGIIATLLVTRGILYYATDLAGRPPDISSAIDLLLTALTTAALGWLAIDLIERRRVSRPHPPVLRPSGRAAGLFTLAFVVAGGMGASLLWVYERILQRIVSHTDVDLLHFSLHPLSGTRFALAFALVLLDAAVVWSAAAIIRVPALVCRAPRTWMWRGLAAAGWIAGALLTTALMPVEGSPVPLPPFWVALTAAGVAAIVVGRVSSQMRRASQAARLIAFFLALLAPAVAMYPSLFAFATDAKELLVAGEYAPQALRLRDDLKLRLGHTLDQIDAMSPPLEQFVVSPAGEMPAIDRASVVWSKTDLATYRLTSAVELYGADGRLVSRFEILPEYTRPSFVATSCTWEAFDEVAPFGSSTRYVLRASRGICVRGRPIGAVVVRAMLDYRTLPFISSHSPYLESVRPTREARVEGLFGRDVEFVVYGWSRVPIFASGTRVWTLPDRVFERVVASRDPIWETLDRDEQRFRVYFRSDRGGIYALGYPVISWFGHFMNIAELVALIGVLYLTLLAAATLFNILSSRAQASGRALLREVRSSFYRKLFLAFWAVAVLPVTILAFATQRYFAAQLLASVDEAAGRTVTVAQRLVEDYATLQPRGPSALTAIDDQIMVLVRRAIDEDVNLFDRDHLQATSARDLFASQLLSTRTPGEIYKTILLDRMPTFVGDEEVGDVRYRLAAAPVRAGGREGIVTVPLASRQQEIDEQIDELDRRVLSAAVLFSLFGAAIGYWMAERIADPVNRLTRATRRIARGDLDARIAATSSDELRRLVEDFNQMAADLKRQRAELERTQRIEAWADMARQVAHDIKNPLTPIQLSAEHVRRVNIDRGRPLSPVLDDCVNAILSQVRLLRQISAEFSSFASAPVPRPEPTALADLIEEVVESYRTGLAGRVAIVVDTPPDLPLISIDRTLFSRALTNIIENALHAMPGGGRLAIAVRVATDPSAAQDGAPPARAVAANTEAANPRRLLVEITDSGIGMDQEAIGRIFEPYFSTKATGTGLGLTIAKRNIELNGGTIAVRSQRGMGTTVTLTLPLV